MAAAQDVHVRICNQEIVKFDLEVKALIQVLIPGTLGPSRPNPELRWPPVGSAVSLPSFPHLVRSPRSLALPYGRLTSPLYPFGPFPLALSLRPGAVGSPPPGQPYVPVPDQASPLWPRSVPPLRTPGCRLVPDQLTTYLSPSLAEFSETALPTI